MSRKSKTTKRLAAHILTTESTSIRKAFADVLEAYDFVLTWNHESVLELESALHILKENSKLRYGYVLSELMKTSISVEEGALLGVDSEGCALVLQGQTFQVIDYRKAA